MHLHSNPTPGPVSQAHFDLAMNHSMHPLTFQDVVGSGENVEESKLDMWKVAGSITGHFD